MEPAEHESSVGHQKEIAGAVEEVQVRHDLPVQAKGGVELAIREVASESEVVTRTTRHRTCNDEPPIRQDTHLSGPVECPEHRPHDAAAPERSVKLTIDAKPGDRPPTPTAHSHDLAVRLDGDSDQRRIVYCVAQIERLNPVAGEGRVRRAVRQEAHKCPVVVVGRVTGAPREHDLPIGGDLDIGRLVRANGSEVNGNSYDAVDAEGRVDASVPFESNRDEVAVGLPVGRRVPGEDDLAVGLQSGGGAQRPVRADRKQHATLVAERWIEIAGSGWGGDRE